MTRNAPDGGPKGQEGWTTATRQERDTFGDIEVPADRYWGAQTQRSIENFPIGRERYRMLPSVVRAMGVLKKGASITNSTKDKKERVGRILVGIATRVAKPTGLGGAIPRT